MRGFYITLCLLLGASAVLGTVSVVQYDYKNSSLTNEIFTSEDEEALNIMARVQRQSDVIFEKDPFSDLRGSAKDLPGKVPVKSYDSKYAFELRGINAIGEKQVALLTYKSTDGKTVNRSTGRMKRAISQASNVHIVKVGQEIDNTGCILKSISGNSVQILDAEGKEMEPLIFSLISDESLHRGELAYKDEKSRQKKQRSAKSPETKSKSNESSLKSREEK